MDEYFNFEEATGAPGALSTMAPIIYPSNSSYDFNMNLALAHAGADDSYFTCMQHFSDLPISSTTSAPSLLSSPPTHEPSSPWWSGTAYRRATLPCRNCHVNSLECIVLPQDDSKTECCLSCLALTIPCSWVHSDISAGPNPVFSSELNSTASRDKSTSYPTPRSSSEGLVRPDILETAPKVGARFSREAVRILKHWLSSHHRHPYPTDEEKEELKRKTGLSKTQITNWLANARRRGKGKPSRTTSPSQHQPIHHLKPAFVGMNPMERWQRTPPENEAVSVSLIAKAVTSSSLSTANESTFSHTDEGSGRSRGHVSSASSVAEGSSAGSFGSALSHHSRGSFGSFGKRGRRRRRRQIQKPINNAAIVPLRQFQCTFCTETFKTKHDWQRHEKSLHLSLERWICAPAGPASMCKENHQLSCVFCGLANPDQRHMETHNYSSCLERSLEERTFYRKDHLRQHLRLVHDTSKFLNWSMDTWKVPTPEIRSRCGFCGLQLDTWANRVDHLAEHFKSGKSMADWRGDWGFDAQVTDMVENSIPPCKSLEILFGTANLEDLIHSERISSGTDIVQEAPIDSIIAPYDLVKTSLMDHVNHLVSTGQRPTDLELQMEGFRLIYGVSASSSISASSSSNWISEIFRATEDESWEIQCRQATGHENEPLTLEQRRLIFEQQDFETSLREWARDQISVGLSPSDDDLRQEACRLLGVYEAASAVPCETALQWFQHLVRTNNVWLANFRKRTGLVHIPELSSSQSSPQIGISIGTNAQDLEADLAEFVQMQASMGLPPSDEDLRNQARWVVFGSYDSWNHTPADDPRWLLRFKQNHGFILSEAAEMALMSQDSLRPYSFDLNSQESHWDMTLFIQEGHLGRRARSQVLASSTKLGQLRHIIHDANCYRRLENELAAFVSACLSPQSPNPHIPTDEELQEQARWIVFASNDAGNKTAADNSEWLQRFKRSHNLSSEESGPGLPSKDASWDVRHGGTGFYPPYVFPRAPLASYQGEMIPINITKPDGTTRTFQVRASTANAYMESFAKRFKPPAAIFCSRELETGLKNYVRNAISSGYCPSDNDLRMWARKILGVPRTAADDGVLLQRFKEMYGLSDVVGLMNSEQTTLAAGAPRLSLNVSQPPSPGAYLGGYRSYRSTASPLAKQASLARANMQFAQGYHQTAAFDEMADDMSNDIM